MPGSNEDLGSEREARRLGATLDISARLLSTDEVARLLVVPIATLYCWRYKGTGPRAFKVGKHLRYRLADVLAWLEQQTE